MKIVEKRPAMERFDYIVNRWKEQLIQCQTDTNELVFRLRDFVQTELDINRIKSNRWIPCNERLPEQGERVIVAIFGSDMIMPNEGETLQDAIERSRKEGYITVGFIGSDGWYGADWFPLMVQPSYWMPKPDLPEPPEKE